MHTCTISVQRRSQFHVTWSSHSYLLFQKVLPVVNHTGVTLFDIDHFEDNNCIMKFYDSVVYCSFDSSKQVFKYIAFFSSESDTLGHTDNIHIVSYWKIILHLRNAHDVFLLACMMKYHNTTKKC